LRQPIEDKLVTISRAKGSLSFPANFMLVAAHNPCPCGYFGDTARACSCSPSAIKNYQAKLSGPLLDRIDIHVDVPRVDYQKLMSQDKAENSATIQARVEKARLWQSKRFEGRSGLYANGDMTTSDIQEYCILEKDARQIMEVSINRMQLSARSYHRVLKLSRTIADLAESETIGVQHVAEALQYRPK
jgi:magnesium chelatase family protein